MDFQQSLDYLYGLQQFGIKLGLGNMRALEDRIEELQAPLACVHVAGTNGKGSVSAMLAEILHQSGLKCGLYSSPHLHCFNERIRIDGEPLPTDEIALLADEIRSASGGIPVTFFEATTAMALLAFRRHKVDVAVIETGMGGRLDATNLVDPLLTLITPVGLDHQEHLGATLEEIAGEKAGIIKAGVPVIVGGQASQAVSVLLSRAEQVSAPVMLAGRDYWHDGDHQSMRIGTETWSVEGVTCRMAGDHQRDNLAQAVAAAMALREQGYAVSKDAIQRAGQRVNWPGRLEWVGPEKRILLDAAHNASGVACLDAYLSQSGIAQVRLVAALSRGRSAAEVFAPLKGKLVGVYAVSLEQEGMTSPEDLVRWAVGEKYHAAAYEHPESGLKAALESLEDGETLVVCGSLYLVAAVRSLLVDEHDPHREQVTGLT